VRIDASGVALPPSVSRDLDVVSVRLDGRRVWSFRPGRDLTDGAVSWPVMMRRRLSGTANVQLVDHASGRELGSADVVFGTGRGRAELVDSSGNPLVVDKGGRLQRTFEESSGDARAQLVEAAQRVAEALRGSCGVDAYLAYGCLLGAVRDGRMIGHDADVDLAYLSRHTHPFDIIRENRAIRATLEELGWESSVLSSAAFKIWLPLGGRRVGIDVFGSFYIGGSFHLMGSLRGELDRSAVLPLGSVELEGVTLPAPADPERFLEFTYGPGWRVPDPAFSFDHEPAVVRRMDSLFRRHRLRYRFWTDFYRSPASDRIPREPSLFARWVDERVEPGSTLLDIGCGDGRDAIWFAQQGHPVVAMDFAGSALRTTERRARARGVEVPTMFVNFEDLQRTLVAGGRLAHQPGERHVHARGLLDTLAATGRANFWRFSSMVQRRGGLLFVEFRTPTGRDEPMAFGRHARTFLDPDEAVAEVRAAGGTVVDRVVGRGLAPFPPEDPEVCRLVVRWR
jgi:SAM-dependent methyltransferase